MKTLRGAIALELDMAEQAAKMSLLVECFRDNPKSILVESLGATPAPQSETEGVK